MIKILIILNVITALIAIVFIIRCGLIYEDGFDAGYEYYEYFERKDNGEEENNEN